MSLTLTVLMLITAWLSVAAAMLWGVLRIARRHHLHHQHPETHVNVPEPRRAHRRPANAH